MRINKTTQNHTETVWITLWTSTLQSMADNEGDLALRFIQSIPFSGSMADKSRSQFLLKISRVCYIFRHWLPVIWTFKICLEATRSLMNYILLTFYSEMHKETWFSPFTNAMRGMATENMKFKENNSLSMYSGLLLLLLKNIYFPH